jgi:hypothetical protein
VSVAGYDDALKIFAEARGEKRVRGFRLLEPLTDGRIAYDSAARAYADTEDNGGRVIAAIAACAVDEDGALLFDTSEKIKALRETMPARLATELFNACFDLLSVASPKEVDDAEGE